MSVPSALPQLGPDDPPPPHLIDAVRAVPGLSGAARPVWTPLHGGRVNRLWRVGPAVVKLYDPAGSSPLFPNAPAVEAAALTALRPAGLAPALLGCGADWIAYRYLPGTTWRGAATGPDTPQAAAGLLARLHGLPVEGLPFRVLPSGAAALVAQGRAILSGCRGGLPEPPSVADTGPVRRPVPLHGDAVPGNMIAGPRGLTLIDWQCPALGDPAEDLAGFLSPAMQWLYRGAPLAPAESAAFLAAYPDPAAVARYRALAPLFRWRMAAHCLWRAERGAPDYARAQALELEG